MTTQLIDFFDHGASLYPERDCFVAGDIKISYRQAQSTSCQLARALIDLDLPSDTVAGVLAPNDPRAVISTLGIIRSGLIWQPINPRNTPESNAELLSRFKCRVLFYHSFFTEIVNQYLEQMPDLQYAICIDQPSKQHRSLAEWLASYDDSFFRLEDVSPEDQLAMMTTGGTTGKSKGVIVSHRSMATYCSTHLMSFPVEKPPVFLAAAPLTHAAGAMCFPLMAQGTTIVVLPKPEPDEMLNAIADYGVTIMMLPPTVIYRLMKHPRIRDIDYSSLEYFMYGAAPMSVDKLKEAIDIFGPVMAQSFGQTEAPMLCTTLRPEEHVDENGQPVEELLASCGRPTPLVKLQIQDENGNEVPRGERGEICIAGDLLMSGYYNNPQATEETLINGWLHTGDIGYQNEQGYVFIVDRKKDMVITGGFNVYPSQIEQVIWGHPGVQDCAVIGVPDEEWGEAVKAVVELNPGAEVTAEEIMALCKEKLGSVKTPKTVEFVEMLPRSPVGKVLKSEIRKLYWNDQARAI